MRTELEKLIDIYSGEIKIKLKEFETFRGGTNTEELNDLEKAFALMKFIAEKNRDTIIVGEIDGTPEDIKFSILYKILAEHIGIHNKKDRKECMIAFSNTGDSVVIHFKIDKKTHIIDIEGGTFDKKPARKWKKELEPATEVEDEIVVKHMKIMQVQNWKERLKLCNEIESALKNVKMFWQNKGVVLSNLRKYEDAKECFEKALEIKKNDYMAWYNLCCALHKNEEYEEALEAYKKAVNYGKDKIEREIPLIFLLPREILKKMQQKKEKSKKK